MTKPTTLALTILTIPLFLFSWLNAEEPVTSSIEEAIIGLEDAFFFSDDAPLSQMAELVAKAEEEGALESSEEVEEQPISEAVMETVADRAISVVEPSMIETSRESALLPEFKINYGQVFKGAPVIYTLLFLMSMATVFIWLYTLSRLKAGAKIPQKLLREVRESLLSARYERALALCTTQNTLFCRMLSAGIAARAHGLPVVVDTMKAEGKRSTIAFWQRLGFLSDIAMIAPMIGLLGTVLGMFFAFYDLNRSMESFSVLFDGLGISVGTTVAGMVVAILALMLHSLAKFRLVRQLVRVENEAQALVSLIDRKIPLESLSEESFS